MEKSIITTGKTIDAAVETALAQLGLTRDDVTYQVITLPKSGFLGIGAVPAKVQVTYEAPDLKPAVKVEAPKAEEKKPEAPKAEAAPKIALSSASRSKPKAPKAEIINLINGLLPLPAYPAIQVYFSLSLYL